MPIPPVTEFEGQLPNEGEPASFPARAEALFDWLVGQGMPEFNAAVAAINIALNDNGTVLDTAGKAIALTTNANTLVATGGTGDAYTITPAVAVAAYQDGQSFLLRTNRLNTGAVTLKVGALAAVPVRKLNADGTTFAELVAGDFRPGEVHLVGYRAGQFELLSTPLNRFVRSDAVATVTANWTFEGSVIAQALSTSGLTATGGVTVARNGPQIVLDDTVGTANTHRWIRDVYSDSNYAIDILSSAGDFVGRIWDVVAAATGATRQAFRIGPTERLVISSGGITVGGTTTTDFLRTLQPSIVRSLFAVNASEVLGRPHTNAIDGALNGFRWSFIYLQNAPNVASDVRDKDEIEAWTEDELRVGLRLRSKRYRRISTDTRHAGYIAQEIVAAFVAEGFDEDHPVRIGLLTRNENGIYGVDLDAVNAFRIDALAAAVG